MTNFKNMKIEVTADQPLEEIVRELESKGYMEYAMTHENPRYISTTHTGWYFDITHNDKQKTTTTLAELKEM